MLAFWGSEISGTFFRAQMMLGTCQMVHSWEGERLGKGFWLPSVSLNSSSYILMHTHRCFMWLEAEGNTCHSSWTQSSQIFRRFKGEGQCWVAWIGQKVLDPSERFSPVVHALVLMSQPVSAVWKYLEADCPSAFYTWRCVQVPHQEPGTCGTCAWSAAQPSALFLILAWWISLYMGLSQNGASVTAQIDWFLFCTQELSELCYFAFLVWCLLSPWSGFNVTAVWILWDVACSFLKTILWIFIVQCGVLN